LSRVSGASVSRNVKANSIPSSGPEHVPQADLKLFALERLTESKSAVIRAHLAECGTCRCWFDETVEFARQLAALNPKNRGTNSPERRGEPRFLADEVASMQMVNPLLLDKSEVQVVNVSKSGLMLRTAEFLQVGIVIQIRLKKRFVLGEVRYCVPVADFFHVGVQIQGSQWRRGANDSDSLPFDDAALPLEKRYVWRIASALTWALAELETLKVEGDRQTLSLEDHQQLVDLLKHRPEQFCLFLSTLFGQKQMELMMVSAIRTARVITAAHE
jgi:hypothetical protein